MSKVIVTSIDFESPFAHYGYKIDAFKGASYNMKCVDIRLVVLTILI